MRDTNESIVPGVYDAGLTARIRRRVPLFYDGGADASIDLPAHVRAASSLARIGSYLVVIQDDANFVALIDPEKMSVRPLPLPAGAGGLRQFDDRRGNKHFKLDLEACCAVRSDEAGELLVAFGSGTKPNRERVLIVQHPLGEEPEISIYEAAEFYAELRRERKFSGSELNIEGAIFRGGKISLINRNNGAAGNELSPVNAICRIRWDELYRYLQHPLRFEPPRPGRIVQYELGTLGGVSLGLTDAALVAENSTVIFSAAAEASPDAVRDGFVAGSVIGVFDDATAPRWTPLADSDGTLFAGKVEGLQTIPGDAGKIFAVLDADDPAQPSELCEVELTGEWFGDESSVG